MFSFVAQNSNRHFPERILYEIASWLPPKSVGRFTTVNKSCNDFIKSSIFTATHLSRIVGNMDDDDSRNYILHMPSHFFGYEKKACKVFCGNLMSWKEEYQVEWPARCEFFLSEPVGTCNGIVCFTNGKLESYGRVLYLWNPILRKFKCIKSTSFNILYDSVNKLQYSVGFWYDNINNDYKLLRIVQAFSSLEMKQCQVEVFSLKARSWKRLTDVEVPPLHIKSRIPSVADGRINWLVHPRMQEDGNGFIYSFDTRTETFRQVKLPPFEEPLVRFPDLIVYRGFLALIVVPRGVRTDWSVWVMKQFGVAETWQKMFVVRTREKPLGVKFAKKENIIFLCDDFRLAVCDIKKQRTRFLKDDYYSDFWVDYSETISFLGDEDELLE